MAAMFLVQRGEADSQQVQPDGVGSSYQFGEAARLRQRVLAGGTDAVDIEGRFAGGREKFAYTRDAKRSLLVGSELAANFEDTSLHNASRAEWDEILDKAMEVLGAGSNREYVKLLRMLETWLLVVVPDEFVALTNEPADGWKPLPTATLERYVQFGQRAGRCVCQCRCVAAMQVHPRRREWQSGEGRLLGRRAEGAEVACAIWQVQGRRFAIKVLTRESAAGHLRSAVAPP